MRPAYWSTDGHIICDRCAARQEGAEPVGKDEEFGVPYECDVCYEPVAVALDECGVEYVADEVAGRAIDGIKAHVPNGWVEHYGIKVRILVTVCGETHDYTLS